MPCMHHTMTCAIPCEVAAAAMVDAADAVLQDNIAHLPAAITMARRAKSLVVVNIILAVVMSVASILVVILVDVPLWLGAIFDNGSLLIVLLNSLWPLCWIVSYMDEVRHALCYDRHSAM